MYSKVKEIIYSEAVIQERISELGKQITKDFENSEITVISLMKSGMFFTADLVRAINCPLTVDFLEISSYGCTNDPSQPIQIKKDIEDCIENRIVIVTDVLADTGFTLDFALKHLAGKKPAKMLTCVLLDNRIHRLSNIGITYSGFTSNNCDLAGYGLDFDGISRHFPFICKLRK